MNIVYDISLHEDAATIISAKCQLPLFGRWLEMVVTSYCLHDYSGIHTTAINFGLKPIKNEDVRGSTFNAAVNGLLKLSRGKGTTRQDFDQKLEVPIIFGSLLDYSDLTNGGVPAGRTVTDSLLRRTESIFETIRQRIILNLSREFEVRELALQTLDSRYSKITNDTISQFLGKIDWRLMLAKSGCDDDQLNVIEYAMQHNPPRFHSILEEPSNEIPLITNAPIRAFSKGTLANIKATALLRNVCGDKLHAEFEAHGRITVEEQGFTFVIRPHHFIDAVDPNGKKARLCIHTLGFQCNPVDELIIAYLHIKHKLVAYLNEAIVHGPEPGFSLKVS